MRFFHEISFNGYGKLNDFLIIINAHQKFS
jgi:hypothetical protein